MSVREELVRLRDRAWTTSGSRYNAARRLRSRSKLSLLTIALISALGVAAPLLLTSAYFSEYRDGLTLFAALLSLFILVVAIIEGAAGFDAKADALFRNAEAVNSLRLEVNAVLATEEDENAEHLHRLVSNYNRIKESCSVNHEVVDYKKHQASHPDYYKLQLNWWDRAFASLAYVLYSTWWLLLILIASAIGFVAVFSGASLNQA